MATEALLTPECRPVSNTPPQEAQVPPRDFLDLTGNVHDDSGIELLREILRTSRKIVVVAGAGISVAAGIPDFRGAKGMFSRMKSKGRSGQMMFDTSVYRSPETIEDFHEMIGNLYDASKSTEPTPFHKLLDRLAKTNRLLRLYTQNIDFLDTRHENLKTVVPVPAVGPWPKTIAVHGSLEKMTCTKCKVVKDFNPELFRIWKEDTPECIDCKRDEDARVAAGRRKLGVGFIRPRMVLYGEPGFDALNIGSCMASDLRNRPDALIVVGTTLKIPGTRTMVKEMSKAIGNRGHIIWLNMDDAPGGEFEDVWDFVIKGDCQKVAELMQDIPIHPKDQSFVLEEPLNASQSTVADLSCESHNGEFWKVVNNANDGSNFGLLTPASSIPSSSDDEKSIKSQLLLKQGIPLKSTLKKGTKTIVKTSTSTFYAPLSNQKAVNPLKRKRAQASCATDKIKNGPSDSISKLKKVQSASTIKSSPKPKTAKKPSLSKKTKTSFIVKLRISPSINDHTQDVSTQTNNDIQTPDNQLPDPATIPAIIPAGDIITNTAESTHSLPTTTDDGSTSTEIVPPVVPLLETEATLEDESIILDRPGAESSDDPILPDRESVEPSKQEIAVPLDTNPSTKRGNKWVHLERRKSNRISASRSDSA